MIEVEPVTVLIAAIIIPGSATSAPYSVTVNAEVL